MSTPVTIYRGLSLQPKKHINKGQRIPKGQPRINNQEKPKGQPRMNNQEKQKGQTYNTICV